MTATRTNPPTCQQLGNTQEERKVTPNKPSTMDLLAELSRLTGRPFTIPAEPEPLGDLIAQLDDVHSELPALLRDPGINDADYGQLWDAHEHISKALAIMVRVQRRGDTK